MASPAPGVSFFTPANVENGTTTYVWDFMNRLVGVAMANGRSFGSQYDYRSRRVGITDVLGQAKHTAISFSEGLSVAEWEITGGTGPVVSGPENGVRVQLLDKIF